MEFCPECRVWIFPLERQVSAAQKAELLQSLQRFVDSWAAHKVPVRGQLQILHEKFIVVSADEEAMKVSGCSIDGLFRTVFSAVESLGNQVSDAAKIHFRGGNEMLRTVSRKEFRGLAAAGEISADSIVFDTTLMKLSQMPDFERRLKDSWHAQLLLPGAS